MNLAVPNFRLAALRLLRSAGPMGLGILLAGAFAFNTPVLAQSAPPVENTGCILDQPGAPNGLNCTANDTTLSTPVVTVSDPCDFPGDTATLDVVVDITVGAQTRYDLAIWLSVDGDPNNDGAASGICSVVTVPTDILHSDGVTPTQLDGDACGDVANVNAGPHILAADLGTVTLLCEDTDGDGNLNVPLIVAWEQQANNNCTVSSDAVPGTASKCVQNLDGQVPVPVPARIIVNKDTQPDDPRLFDFNLSGPVPMEIPPGGFNGSLDFQLADNGTWDSGVEVPGGIIVPNPGTGEIWSVTEQGTVGYDSVGTCTSDIDGTNTNPASLELRPGETVTCNFVNQQQTASLTVIKNTNGGDDLFNLFYGESGQTPTAFSLTTAGGTAQTTFQIVDGLGGTFSVGEGLTNPQLTAGWRIESAECVNDNAPGTPIGTVANPSDDLIAVNDVPINPDDSITCTFVNNAAAQLTVTKITQGGDDEFFFGALGLAPPNDSFSLTTMGGSANTGPITVPIPDSSTGLNVDIAEDINNPMGWNLVSITCSGTDETVIGNLVDITLQPGDVVDCTFTNVADGQISVVKNTVGGDGAFGYSTDIPGVPMGLFTLTTVDNSASASIATPPPGTYFIREAVPNGWDLTNIACGGGSLTTFTYTGAPMGDTDAFEPGDNTININLAAGEDISCTFTNTQRGIIEIVKETAPNPPTGGSPDFGFTGTIVPAVFTLANGENVESTNVLPGAYTVTEDDPTGLGFDLTALECVDDADMNNVDVVPSTVDLGTRTATLNVDPGERVRCTFTNTQRGSVTVVKSVSADGPVVNTFDFTSADFGDFSLGPVTAGNDAMTTFGDLVPGVYAVAEDEMAALANGWALTGMSCSDGSDPSAIDVAAGENVVCTFTNSPIGSATIIKNTIGGDDTFAFTGDAPFDGLMLNTGTIGGTASADFSFQLDPSQNPYIVQETIPAGWRLTDLGCVEDGLQDTLVGITTGTATINAQLGEQITCTYENTANGTLTIRKETLPDGFDLPFEYTGVGPEGDIAAASIRDFSAFGEEIVINSAPGVYTITETVPMGWQVTGISCPGGVNSTVTFTGAAVGDTDAFELGDDTANVDLAPGESVTCTFENTQESSITIVKSVVGADGVFNFGATGTGVSNFAIDTAMSDTNAFTGLLTGPYMISENPIPMGYQLTNIECTGGANVLIGMDDVFDMGDTGVSIDLGPGEDVICTFTNTETGSITVAKTTEPAGSADSFTFSGDAAGMITDGQTIVVGNLLPGQYVSFETVPDGWDLTDITCSDDDSVGEVGQGAVFFTVAAGEDVTCTFTNTQRGSLTVVKNVLNDNGGNDTVADFMVMTTAGALTFDGGVVNGDTTTYTATVTDLVPGDFQVSEADNPGYTEGSWSCTSGDSGPFGGATVTVGAGENITCSITNDDIAPTLTLTKVVNNNFFGTSGPDDFGISVDGMGVTSGATLPYDANTALVIDEVLVAGYEFVSLTGDAACPQTLGGSVILDEGAVVSCTITNQDLAPDINLAKSVASGPTFDEMARTFTVTYTIDAVNNGGGPGEYNLVDTFSPAPGVTVDSATIMYAGGETQTGMVTSPFMSGGTAVMGEALGIGASESWTVTAVFSIDLDVVDEAALACDPGNPVINTGFYNYVEGVVGGETDTTDNDACTGLMPPSINLAKTVVGTATLEMDGTYTVVYTISATNETETPGTYNLVDTFSPAAGITLNTADIVYAGGEMQDTMPGPYPNFVTGESLNPGATESWTVTANFTVDPAVLDPADAACDPGNPVINTGFYNAVAGVDMEADTSDNDTCTGVPDPDINLAKTVDGPATVEMDGTYTVVYTVTATNNGDGPGIYNLVDTFSPAVGVTLNTAEIAYGGGETETGMVSTPFMSGDTVVTGEALAGGGASETWTITANFTVDPAVLNPDDAQCDPQDATNTGFYNEVSGVDMETDTSDNGACTGIDVPTLTLVKAVDGGTAVPADFLLTLTGADNTHAGGVNYTSGMMPPVSANVEYTITETPDQVPDYVEAGIACVDDDTQAEVPHPVTLGATQSVTCTLTNQFQEIVIELLNGVCINDVPYISWDLNVLGVPGATDATVRIFGDGGNGSANEGDYVNLLGEQTNLPLTGQTLWPGAAVDMNGNGTDWPGWDLVDGVWVEDPTDERVPTILVQFEVNPTAQAIVAYPPQSAACIPPQDVPPEPVPPALPVPVDGPWALWLLTLLMLATGLTAGHRRLRRR